MIHVRKNMIIIIWKHFTYFLRGEFFKQRLGLSSSNEVYDGVSTLEKLK